MTWSYSFLLRAIFYEKNEDAAKAKGSSTLKRKRTALDNDSIRTPHTFTPSSPFTFPSDGWSHDRSCVPSVCSKTAISLLRRTGKSVPGDAGMLSITVPQKPLRRGREFFFSSYVHDVCVAQRNGAVDEPIVFVRSKCWASQKL